MSVFVLSGRGWVSRGRWHIPRHRSRTALTHHYGVLRRFRGDTDSGRGPLTAHVRCSFGQNQRRRGREPEPEPEREPQQQREPRRELKFDNAFGERPSASAEGAEASSAAWEKSPFAPFNLPLQSEEMEIWSVCDDSESEDDDGERCVPLDGSVRVYLRSRAHSTSPTLLCCSHFLISFCTPRPLRLAWWSAGATCTVGSPCSGRDADGGAAER
jgi:hypothetical protein